MAIRSVCAFLVAFIGLEASPVLAGLVATASGVGTPTGSDYNYNITLHDTGTTTVGTYWFAWTQIGYNFMATAPLSVTAPAGWSYQVTNNGPGFDGYGIEYTANTSASYLTPGGSLLFGFQSADTPASIEGTSVYYPGFPTETSFVYSQGAFSDAGYQFLTSVTPAAVPEPSSLLLTAAVAAVAVGIGYMWRKAPLVA